MRSLSICVLSVGLLIGCGGGSSNAPVQDPSPSVSDDATPVEAEKPAEAKTESAEQKLARQQMDAVEKTCERLIECSLAEASPEEIKKDKLDDPRLLAKAQVDCTDTYSAAMSPRQVKGVRACLGEASECNAFADCFFAALNPAKE